MNMQSLTPNELRNAAEYSVRPEYMEAARAELLRRQLGRTEPPLTGWRLTKAMQDEPPTRST